VIQGIEEKIRTSLIIIKDRMEKKADAAISK